MTGEQQQSAPQEGADPKFTVGQKIQAAVGSEQFPSLHVGTIVEVRPKYVGTEVQFSYVVDDNGARNEYPEEVLSEYKEPAPETKQPDNANVDQKTQDGTQAPVFVISAAVASGKGTMSPTGSVQVKQGDNASFIFFPGEGQKVSVVVVDGQELDTPGGSCSFTNVQADHTLGVTFAEMEGGS
jgi:hypothetical protein